MFWVRGTLGGMGSRYYLTRPMRARWARAVIRVNLGDVAGANGEIVAAVGDQWRRYEPTGGAFGWEVRLTDHMPKDWAFLHYGTWNLLVHPDTYALGFENSGAIRLMRDLAVNQRGDGLHRLDTEALVAAMVDAAIYRSTLPTTLSPEDLLELD